ncbi:unnamed protein product [Protopolystoma xenopodis]|uniref:Fibronectin type-III domain-containing protein n=1 Tax=Protopolystoma xenopodis TaxID=117903 RepID=A0A3S5FBM0_9PLAT|nr:unnamed protein product [Protopolystoma xenopodis]
MKSYVIYYTRQLDAAISRWESTTVSEQTFLILTNLQANATYFLKIRAVNAAGLGPLSEAATIIVTPGLPPAPQDLIVSNRGSTSLELKWQSPSLTNNIHLTGYTLKYRAESDSNHNPPGCIETPAPNRESFTIKGLYPNTRYFISLQAVSRAGEGIAAQISERTLPECKY